MSDERAFLLNALRRIRDGGTVTNDELLSIIPDPALLEELERSAWYRLSHWADDDDIRAKDSAYRDMQRRQIGEALADLEALEAGYSPGEVSAGEHQAWHVPIWVCLLLGVVGIAAIYFLSNFRV